MPPRIPNSCSPRIGSLEDDTKQNNNTNSAVVATTRTVHPANNITSARETPSQIYKDSQLLLNSPIQNDTNNTIESQTVKDSERATTRMDVHHNHHSERSPSPLLQNTNTPANSLMPNNLLMNNPLSNSLYSPYGGMGGMMYGSPYYGSSYNNMMGGGGPLQSLNQFLFGIQNLVFSATQAVHIIGMNTQAIQQLLESVSAMMDHAVQTFREVQQQDQRMGKIVETPQERKRRRRLRALRWAAVTVVTYAGYRLVRTIVRLWKQRRPIAYRANDFVGPYRRGRNVPYNSGAGYGTDPSSSIMGYHPRPPYQPGMSQHPYF